MLRLTILAASTALVLSGCGSSDSDDKKADPPTTSKPTTQTTSEAPEGESNDCLVATSKWLTKAQDLVLEAATTAPAFGERLDLDQLEGPQATLEVLCSAEIVDAVHAAMVPLADINYEISLCGLGGGCDDATIKKVHKIAANKAATLVGKVQELVDAG